MTSKPERYRFPMTVAVVSIFLLAMVQWKVERPVILLERFIPYGGWIEIPFIGIYAAFVADRMRSPRLSRQVRKVTWAIFSVVFFSQFALGLMGFEKFLMTGELHLPVPAIIAAGSVYRFEFGFMPILFLSTIVLSGPAWCSHLCYFGALDNLAATGPTPRKPLKFRGPVKFVILAIVIITAFMLRITGASSQLVFWLALGFGIVGLLLLLLVSRRQHRMIHCVLWCPIGTLVSYMRFINPFRMHIDQSCNRCLACTPSCKYDALSAADILSGKPGITCTLCGDCVTTCHTTSIRYKFPGLGPDRARLLWIGTTVVLHAVFLALARI